MSRAWAIDRHRRRRRRFHRRRRRSFSPSLPPPSASHSPCPRRPCPRPSAASTTSLPSSRLHRRLSSSPAPAPLLSAPMSMGRGSPPPAFNFTQTQRSDHILKHVGCSNNVSRVRHRRGFVSRRSHIKSQVHLHLKQGVLCLSAQETLPVVGLHVDHRCWGVASVNQGTSALTLQKDGLIFASCVGLILAMRIEPAGCLHRDILPLLK